MISKFNILMGIVVILLFGFMTRMPYAHADDQIYSDTHWEETCAQYKHWPLPAADMPTPQEAKALKNCSSNDLYYGFGQPINRVKARKCAYTELKNGDDLVFGGSSILMNIYANGTGAKRNLDLAIHFACNVTGNNAIAEMEYRLGKLEYLKKTHWTGHHFDVCDDITSGYMEGFCTSNSTRYADFARDKKMKALMAHWTPREKVAFKKLDKAANAFIESRSTAEVDLTGTGRAAFIIEEEQVQKDSFYSLLAQLQHGKLRHYKLRQYKEADKDLNESYQTIQHQKWDADALDTITQKGIQETELKWLNYRDAWVRFARVKYPHVPAYRIQTKLTLDRIDQLDALAHDDSH